MEDMAEKVAMITDRIDLLATQTAREEEIRIALQGYKLRVDTESLMEMRSVFGEGTRVKDILTGEVMRV